MSQKKIPHYYQMDSSDCGPTCLRIIAKYYNHELNLEYLRTICNTTSAGTSLASLKSGAESIGFETIALEIHCNELTTLPLPCILYVRNSHYVVLYDFNKKNVTISDPAFGRIKYSHEEVIKLFCGENANGIVLLLKPTSSFSKTINHSSNLNKLKFLKKYLIKFKKKYLLLGIISLSSLGFQLFLPYISQKVIDYGIEGRNINLVVLLLFAGICLQTGNIGSNYFKNMLLLNISSFVNINLISDYIDKLLRLPIKYFHSRTNGDILQRIYDHQKIESFLSNSTLSLIISFANLFIFSIILIHYNTNIFLLFFTSSILYVIWVVSFIKKRKRLEYQKFNSLSENQTHTIQLIQGIQDIKLNNCEKLWRNNWRNYQEAIYKINRNTQKIFQYQNNGGKIILIFRDAYITYYLAELIISGQLSIGVMFAVLYIVGQVSNPLESIVDVLKSAQDASISIERSIEVSNLPGEQSSFNLITIKNREINSNIELNNVSYSYINDFNFFSLNNICCEIFKGKITAIVGHSGCGKSTLIKLLLGLYYPDSGSISIEGVNIKNLEINQWRSNSGSVIQDGFIFSGSIAKNICMSDDYDHQKLIESIKLANFYDFVLKLPNRYETKLGSEGLRLSQGQKQRILIARAIYKYPNYLFLDEATNALDSENEMIILNNIKNHFKNKTIVISAHRLSTIKNVDQIIVLEGGNLTEIGTHDELIKNKKVYYKLFKNQFELGI